MYEVETIFRKTFICIHCQLRLDLQKRPQVRPQCSLQSKRTFALGRRVLQEQVNDNDVEQVYEGAVSIPRIKYNPSKLRPRDSEKRLSFIPTKHSINYDRLGKPAEILVIRDRGRNEKPTIELRPLETSDGPALETISSTGILNEMKAQRGIIDIDQACRNMDAVKDELLEYLGPSALDTPQMATMEKYRQLSSSLHDGFTSTQMAAYLERNAQAPSLDAAVDLHSGYSNKLYTRSSWIPSTAFGGNAGNAEQSKLHRTRKDVLVDSIIRHCWLIRPEEDDAVQGELQIQLQPVHFELIVNHSTLLSPMASVCLNSS